MAKSTWIKIGAVMNKKDKEGKYIKLDIRRDGKPVNEITLKSGEYLQVQNPRKRANITEEELAKIPEFVFAEIYKVVEE